MKKKSPSKLSILIEREYMVRVKKKSFIVTTLLVPILIAAIFFYRHLRQYEFAQ